MVYTQLVLDTRREKALYAVKIRITYSRTQKYYLTGFKMTEAEFRETMKQHPHKAFQEKRIQLDFLELKAKKIINSLDAFSFKSFEDEFYQNKNVGKSIYDLYSATITEKWNDGKISTAINYRCSMNSLKKISPGLSFIDVTPMFLKNYEKHLLNEGKSISTVGIYLRPLRAIINQAIADKILPTDKYPFGLKKYVIPESRNIKKALTRKDFKKIIDYTPEEAKSFEARAKDFWLLSYLCQGMNPKDILLLKRENIDQDFIQFIREKTRDTTRNCIIEIVVPLLPEMKAIIEKWGLKDNKSPFVFGFINENMTPLEIYQTVQQFVKVTNKHMNSIGEKSGIQKKITCYTARFQFSKTMIDADVSLEYLRQCLGHQSAATTQRYIDSFENLKKYEIASKHLLNFDA